MVKKLLRNAYVLLLPVLLPLAVGSSYYDILEVKFVVFAVLTLAAFIVWAVYRLNDMRHTPLQDKVKQGRPGIQDIGLTVLMAASVISYIANMGTGGVTFFGDRYSGLAFVILLAMEYYVLSSTRPDTGMMKTVVIAAMGCCGVIAVVAVLNHFLIDPLGLYKNTWTDGFWSYVSTMGNKTVAGCYFALLLIPAFGLLSAVRLTRLHMTLVYVCIFICSMALISVSSDTAVISLFAGVAALLITDGVHSTATLGRGCMPAFLIGGGVAWIGFFLMGILDRLFTPEGTNNIDSLCLILSQGRIALPAAVILISGGIFLWMIRGKEVKDEAIRKSVLISEASKTDGLYRFKIGSSRSVPVLLLIITFIVGLWAYKSGALSSGDDWGSGRGLIYRCVVDTYMNATDLFGKMFGCGPDSVYYITDIHCGSELLEKQEIYLLDAHNELLQMLLTTGAVGALAYAVFFVGTLKGLLEGTGWEVFGEREERSTEKIIGMICGCVLITYIVQGLFTSMQPFTTPMAVYAAAVGCRFERGEGTPHQSAAGRLTASPQGEAFGRHLLNHHRREYNNHSH